MFNLYEPNIFNDRGSVADGGLDDGRVFQASCERSAPTVSAGGDFQGGSGRPDQQNLHRPTVAPVILTSLAAVLAFIPLTHSVFWGSMAYVLIGGTAVGTVLTLAFLPALYAIWYRVSHADAVLL